MRRALIIVACVFVWALIFWQVAQIEPLALAERSPAIHFVEYWAAGRMQLTGNNPYSADQIFSLQQSVGLTRDRPEMMWNPPWTLLFVMPFGMLSYPIGRTLWLIFHFTIILFCAERIWRLYDGPVHRYWLAWIVCFTFFPSLDVLLSEQISPLILLGFAGFLELERRKQPWLAGSFLVLVAIKPYLAYLFWIALLLWAINQQQWRLLLAGGLSILIATAIPLICNSAVIKQYLYAVVNQPFPATPVHQWATPTLGGLLRLLFGPETFWLQLVPSIFGTVWLLFYWQKHRSTWDWVKQMPLLILVSLSTSPYGWTFDQVVLLPGVVQSALWLFNRNLNVTSSSIIVSYLSINAIAIKMNIARVDDFWYFWLAPTLLIIYLVLLRQIGEEQLVLLPTQHQSLSLRSK
jgi:Glycosyltransferase family 87